MRLPSISFVASESKAVLQRFPVVLGFALLATVAGILIIEHGETQDWRLRLLYTATLGLPLAAALTVFREKAGWGRLAGGLHQLAGIAVLAVLFTAWSHWQEPVVIRRYIQFSLGFHLLAAVLPFLGAGELNGFWQYNRTLFLRFLLSALYAAVLYAGLAVAILALDKLFGLDVKGERYGELWVIVAFLFTTGFFLGGVPGDLKRLDAVTDYPRGLRIFSQFILLPLVTVYLVILTLYMGKIVITRVWPSGWIGYLVSSVAAVGILLLLLVFPVQERAENRWVHTFSRWFYVILLPSIAMLLLALGKRIGQYGLTENRYFMVVLAVWLAAVALYFVLSRGKNIKVIPASLCVLAFVTAFGPWGAYRMSARSQTERLRGLLAAHGLWEDGRIRRGEGSAPFEDRRQISAVLTYVVETHGTAPIADWFPNGLAWADTVGRSRARGQWRAGLVASAVMDTLGIAYVERWQQTEQKTFRWARGGSTVLPPIAGYTTAFVIESTDVDSLILDGRSCALHYETETASLRLLQDGELLIRIPLQGAITYALEHGPRPPAPVPPSDRMVIRVENDRVAALLAVRSLAGHEEPEGPVIDSFSATVFVRF